MIDIPSVPTESLYKFLALVGVISILLSSAFFVTQVRDIRVDNIKLNTKINLYGSNLSRQTKEQQKLIEEYDGIIKYNKKGFADIEKARMAFKKRKTVTFFYLNSKKMTTEQYNQYLAAKFDKDNAHAEKQLELVGKIGEANEVEAIKIEEQKKLLVLNNSDLDYIYKLNTGAMIVGGLCMIYGFVKWSQMQSISDEITRMELAKAKKEFGSEEIPKKVN